MKADTLSFAGLAIAATLTFSACDTAPHAAPPDRTTPAGTARGVNPGNDVTDSGVPESPAAHKSKQQ